mmetsp:Transcript_18705/g.42837  ORF Transcript_18705/g.42837 Transcript_18705/m.42837 type:complete len:235 (-) Transcript_18705:1217-1921(-)
MSEPSMRARDPRIIATDVDSSSSSSSPPSFATLVFPLLFSPKGAFSCTISCLLLSLKFLAASCCASTARLILSISIIPSASSSLCFLLSSSILFVLLSSSATRLSASCNSLSSSCFCADASACWIIVSLFIAFNSSSRCLLLLLSSSSAAANSRNLLSNSSLLISSRRSSSTAPSCTSSSLSDLRLPTAPAGCLRKFAITWMSFVSLSSSKFCIFSKSTTSIPIFFIRSRFFRS